MKRIRFILIYLLLFRATQLLMASPNAFQLQQGGTPSESIESNVINELLTVGNTVWVATGGTLSRTDDLGNSWTIYDKSDGIGRGGISKITERNGVVWLATIIDSSFAGSTVYAGGGLTWSDDFGETWHYIPQPIDSADITEYKPIKTTIENLTWDIALTDSSIWIASWGGGIRMSEDGGQSWILITVDGQPFSPGTNFSHMGFSIVYDENAIWAGTGGGIFKTTDNGETWERFNHRENNIPGNWIRDLTVQFVDDKKIIWASCAETDGSDPTETRGITKSEDNGKTWISMLEGEFAHSFGFESSGAVYVATDNGMFKSLDFGETWAVFPMIQDSENGEVIYTSEMTVMTEGPNHSVWLGAGLEGLAMTQDNGMTWKIFRSFKIPGESGEPESYAYPNPFSPTRNNLIDGDGHVRIQYRLDKSASITLRVYDFGMNLVSNVIQDKFRSGPGDYSEVWNGRNDVGDIVANGVYFYKLEISGRGALWGKVMVVK